MANNTARNKPPAAITPATRTSGTGNSSNRVPFPVFDPAEFDQIGNRNLEMASRAAASYINGMASINREMMSFFNARVKSDIENAQNVMTAKSGEEVFHSHAEFLENAIRDYADEASTILNLAADMTKQTLSTVEKHNEEI